MLRAWRWPGLALLPIAALAAPPFTLTAPGIAAGAALPRTNVYTECGGGNVSPALRWRDPPRGTRSFAVTMLDTSVPGGFWHWIAYDIAIGAHGLNAGAGTPRSGNAPGDTVQLRNDFGNRGYSGPCPPAGPPHRYVITVYALDTPKLGLVTRFSRKDALAAITRHALAHASVAVTWGR